MYKYASNLSCLITISPLVILYHSCHWKSYIDRGCYFSDNVESVCASISPCWAVRWSLVTGHSHWDCPRTRHTLVTAAGMEIQQIDGLVQGRRNSSALAMELRLSCTNPSKWLACIYFSNPCLYDSLTGMYWCNLLIYHFSDPLSS